jgi:hypothetical protein
MISICICGFVHFSVSGIFFCEGHSLKVSVCSARSPHQHCHLLPCHHESRPGCLFCAPPLPHSGPCPPTPPPADHPRAPEIGFPVRLGGPPSEQGPISGAGGDRLGRGCGGPNGSKVHEGCQKTAPGVRTGHDSGREGGPPGSKVCTLATPALPFAAAFHSPAPWSRLFPNLRITKRIVE